MKNLFSTVAHDRQIEVKVLINGKLSGELDNFELGTLSSRCIFDGEK